MLHYITIAIIILLCSQAAQSVTSSTFLLSSVNGQGSLWPSLVPITGTTVINGWWPPLATVAKVETALAANIVCMRFTGNDAITSQLADVERCSTSMLEPSLSAVDDITTIAFTVPSLQSGVWLVWLSINNGSSYATSSASLTTYSASMLSFSLTSPSSVRSTGGNSLTFVVGGLSQAAMIAATTGAATATLTGNSYLGVATTVEFPVVMSTVTAGALVTGLLPDSLVAFVPSLAVTATGTFAVNVSVYLSLNGVTLHDTARSLTIQPSRPLRVLYTYGGPVAQETWSYWHNLARLEVASLWQGSLEMVILDNNGYDAGHITRIRAKLDSDPYIVMVCKTTSNLYSEARQVAVDYPHIHVMTMASPDIILDASGSVDPVLLPNFHVGWINSWEGKYLAGIVAGSLALRYNESKIAFIGGFRIPQVAMNINAFARGVQSVAPNVIVNSRIIGSWFYPYGERLASEVFVSEGNRILHLDTASSDAMTIMSAAGGLSIGANGGDEADESIVTATQYDWTKVHQPYLAGVFDGTLTNQSTFISGVSDGALALSSYSRYVPTAVRNKVTTTVANGASASCLCGPIWDTAGTLVIAAGQCPNASVVGTMAWYARGVIDHGDYNPDAPSIDPSYISVTWLAIFFTVLGAALIASIATCVWIVVKRDIPAIRASSWKFCLCIALGCVLSLTSGFLFGIDQRLADMTTLNGICGALPWVVTMSFSITFGCLFAKVWRVHMIFSATKLQTMALPDRFLALIVSLLATPAVIILITWSAVSPLRWTTVALEIDSDAFPRVTYSQCTSDHTQVFMILLYVYAGGIMLAGNLVSFFSRNVDSRFTESKMINISMINMLQVFLILIPLNYAITNSPDALFVLRAFSVLLINIIVMASIFGPKFNHARPETMVVGGTRASIMSSPQSGTTFMHVRSAFGSQVGASSMHPSVQASSIGNGSNNSGMHRAITMLSPQQSNGHLTIHANGPAFSPPSVTSPGGLATPSSPYGAKQLHTNAALLSGASSGHGHHNSGSLNGNTNGNGNGNHNGSEKHLHPNGGSQSPVNSGHRPGSGLTVRRGSPLQQSHTLGNHGSGSGSGSNGTAAAANGTHNHAATVGTVPMATTTFPASAATTATTSSPPLLPPPSLHDNASMTPLVG